MSKLDLTLSEFNERLMKSIKSERHQPLRYTNTKELQDYLAQFTASDALVDQTCEIEEEEKRAMAGITLQRHHRGWMVTWPFPNQASGWDGRTCTEKYFETSAQFEESGYRKAQRHVRYLKARLRAEFRAGSEGLTAAFWEEWESDWYEADIMRQARRQN